MIVPEEIQVNLTECTLSRNSFIALDNISESKTGIALSIGHPTYGVLMQIRTRGEYEGVGLYLNESAGLGWRLVRDSGGVAVLLPVKEN